MRKRTIMFVGDVHGRFHHLLKLIDQYQPDGVVVCGDFGFWKDNKAGDIMIHQNVEFPVPVYFVAGNHEDHDRLDQLIEQCGYQQPIYVGSNVYFIPTGCVFELFGYSIAGAGGGYSIDRGLRIPHVSWFEQEEFDAHHFARFPRDRHVDIVVAHSCPNSIVDRVAKTCHIAKKNIYCRRTEELLEHVRTLYNPSMWIFGHWHGSGRYRVGKTNFYLLDMLPRENTFKIIKEK